MREFIEKWGLWMNQSYYIFSNGQIKRKDNSLQLCKEDGENRDIPIERVKDIYIFSEMTLNTKLLDFLSQNGVMVHDHLELTHIEISLTDF